MPMAPRLLWLPLLAVCLDARTAESKRQKREPAATMPEGAVVCTTEEQCRQKWIDMANGKSFYPSDDWKTRGCFSKNGHVYFGRGGTTEEMSDPNLPGVRERVWCDPTPEPTKNPTPEPTKSPTPEPTKKPVTDSPTSEPTKRPVTLSPTEEPTRKPVTDAPTKNPTDKPVTDSPTGRPTPSPTAAAVPVEEPGSKDDGEDRDDIDGEAADSGETTTEPSIGLVLAGEANTIGEDGGEATAPDEEPAVDLDLAGEPGTSGGDGAAGSGDFYFLIDVTPVPTPGPVTDSPTEKPTQRPVTESPTALPTKKPATESPTRIPTLKPVTEGPTRLPTLKPVTDGPTKVPSLSPVTDSPTKQPSLSPVTDSPTSHPTLSPVTDSPTAHPTQSPVTDSPTKTPTLSPVTDGPTTSPTISPSSGPTSSPVLPTSSPVELVEAAETGEDSNGMVLDSNGMVSKETPESSNSLALSPFTMKLQTDPGVDSIDSEELSTIVGGHLLEEMKTLGATEVDVEVTPLSGSRWRRLQKGLRFKSDVVEPVEHEFTVGGEAQFAEGSTVPDAESLDIVTRGSFEGEAGDQFVRALQNAEDPGLKSTRLMSVEQAPSEPTEEPEGEMRASYLGNVNEEPVVSDQLYILAIVFGVGFVLVAMYVLKTRRGRKLELENEKIDEGNDEEAADPVPSFPKYIEVESTHDDPSRNASSSTHYVETPCSFYGSIREAISDEARPEEPARNKADLISVLTPDEDLESVRPAPANNTAAGTTTRGTQPQAQQGQSASQGERSAAAQGMQPNVSSKMATQAAPEQGGEIAMVKSRSGLSENLSVFKLDAIEEDSDDGDNWDICGAYGEDPRKAAGNATTTGNTAQKSGSGKKRTEKRVTGSFWGMRPDDFSSETSGSGTQTSASRTMGTNTVTTGGASSGGAGGQDNEDASYVTDVSGQTSKVCNTAAK